MQTSILIRKNGINGMFPFVETDIFKASSLFRVTIAVEAGRGGNGKKTISCGRSFINHCSFVRSAVKSLRDV